MLVSIVINNYNYADFLGTAIESALAQTYAPIEVVVVDDGSQDRSRDVIERFAHRVQPVLKRNGGQASAFNAAVDCSHGEILCFLDADDLFHVDKVEKIVEMYGRLSESSKALLVSHHLRLVDRNGAPIPGRLGGRSRPPFNLYEYAKRYGFTYAPCGPTTGISINRPLARRIFPLPEQGLKVGADDFVRRAASLIGECHSIDEILGAYRVHGGNQWFGTALERSGPPEHIERLQQFLNGLLIANDLDPVISFGDSMYACVPLLDGGKWRALPRQVLHAFARHPDLHTMRFMYLLARDALRRGRSGRRERAA
jgi:glycosyltransferase involved in cell wall biosynthesis